MQVRQSAVESGSLNEPNMPLTSTKKILIVLGLVVFLFVLGIAAIVGWLIWMPEKPTPEDEAKMAEGREFAKTTDQNGCITEGVRRARQIGFLEIGKAVANQYFVQQCLRNSRPTPRFCDGVPGFWNLKGDEWKDAQCEKHGSKPLQSACTSVYDEQINFCGGY
jgi:hypothetical protein